MKYELNNIMIKSLGFGLPPHSDFVTLSNSQLRHLALSVMKSCVQEYEVEINNGTNSHDIPSILSKQLLGE